PALLKEMPGSALRVPLGLSAPSEGPGDEATRRTHKERNRSCAEMKFDSSVAPGSPVKAVRSAGAVASVREFLLLGLRVASSRDRGASERRSSASATAPSFPHRLRSTGPARLSLSAECVSARREPDTIEIRDLFSPFAFLKVKLRAVS